jgi:hypothetical protein
MGRHPQIGIDLGLLEQEFSRSRVGADKLSQVDRHLADLFGADAAF